jgi:hypothetical protein
MLSLCRKLVSAVVVGVRFLEIFKSQYVGVLLLVLAGGLFGSFCISCNTYAYGAIRYSDSIFMYFLHQILLYICDMFLVYIVTLCCELKYCCLC